MSDLYPRFLQWGKFMSKDENNPDVIQCQIHEEDTFETEYGICINVKIDNEIRAINLFSFGSQNRSLLTQWNDVKQKGKIKQGIEFKILTWKGISKTNKDREIRRFKLIF